MEYGWMSEQDGKAMGFILGLVCEMFPEGMINTLEIGVREGRTSRAIHNYLKENSRTNLHSGIDNLRDIKVGAPFPECNFIIGNSMEVYNQIADSSQHFIFQDACHNYPMTMIDFILYSDKVKPNGLYAFHDTAEHIRPFTDYQGMGSKEDQDMFISCRKAINKLGLLDGLEGWKLILDEADKRFPTGGITVFQKMF